MITQIQIVVSTVIAGRETAYSSREAIAAQLEKLIQHAVNNRHIRDVHPDEADAANLVAESLRKIGYEADANIGRDLWELVSEDAQAQWIDPPESAEGVYISLVNVANNMAEGQCYIDFS